MDYWNNPSSLVPDDDIRGSDPIMCMGDGLVEDTGLPPLRDPLDNYVPPPNFNYYPDLVADDFEFIPRPADVDSDFYSYQPFDPESLVIKLPADFNDPILPPLPVADVSPIKCDPESGGVNDFLRPDSPDVSLQCPPTPNATPVSVADDNEGDDNEGDGKDEVQEPFSVPPTTNVVEIKSKGKFIPAKLRKLPGHWVSKSLNKMNWQLFQSSHARIKFAEELSLYGHDASDVDLMHYYVVRWRQQELERATGRRTRAGQGEMRHYKERKFSRRPCLRCGGPNFNTVKAKLWCNKCYDSVHRRFFPTD